MEGSSGACSLQPPALLHLHVQICTPHSCVYSRHRITWGMVVRPPWQHCCTDVLPVSQEGCLGILILVSLVWDKDFYPSISTKCDPTLQLWLLCTHKSRYGAQGNKKKKHTPSGNTSASSSAGATGCATHLSRQISITTCLH